mgnify:FL=1
MTGDLRFFIGATDVSSNYTVSRVTGDAIVNGSNNQTNLTFQILTSVNANTGSLIITIASGFPAANDSLSNQNITDPDGPAVNATTTVQTRAAVRIDRVFGVPIRISQNQTFQVNVSLNNTGETIANVTVNTGDLRFFIGSTDVTSNFTLNGVAGGALINGSNNQSFYNFSVTTSNSANTGSLIITYATGFPLANDSLSNQNVTDPDGPAVNATPTLETRASIAIDRVFRSPATISQNQTFQVNVSINNTGGAIANVTVNTADLRFFIGSTDVTNNYTLNGVAGPNHINGSNNQSVFNFSVTASNSANTGSLIITYATGFPLANDSNNNQNVTDTNGPTVNLTITAQTKASIAIDKFFGIPARVSQNQTFYANLSINNTGEAIANISSNMTNDVRLFIGSTDVTSNYTVSRVTGPNIVNGSGNQSNLTFQILTSINANTGNLIITIASGFPAANDSNSNENITDTNGPAVNGTTTIQTRASIAIDRIRAPPANVSQNQSFTINVTINNTGETIANITVNTADLRFFIGSTDYTSNFSISAVSGNTLINGSGNQSNYTFTVGVLNRAQNGTFNIAYALGFPLANDSLSNQNITDPNGAAVNGTLYVQQAANISITQLTGSPFILGTGVSTIFVGIRNFGEAIADVSAASNVTNNSLVFRMNQTSTIITGLNVTRNDSVTTVAGGATASLTFVVTRNTATYDGNVTVNATLTYNDTNLNTLSINSPAILGNDTTFQIDNTVPVAAGGGSIKATTDKSKATVSFTTDTASTCRYKVDFDASFGSMTLFDTTGGTTHKVEKELDNGIHRIFIRCQDAVGNEINLATEFFDITKGGGSGGGGSGSSSGSAASVSNGEKATIQISNTEATSVTSVTIVPTKNVKDVKIMVNKLFVTPSSPAIEQGQVYKYIMINKMNIEDKDIASAKIRFQVDKSWLGENSLPAETVAMRRLEKDGWKELPTNKVEETETHVVYEAETPGFSTFAITAGHKEIVETPINEVEQKKIEPITSKPKGTTVQPAAKAGKAAEVPKNAIVETKPISQSTLPSASEGANWLMWVISLVVVIVLGYLVFYAFSKKKRPF